GLVERRVVAPPAAAVRVVLPRALAAAEHLPAHHDGAGCFGRFGVDIRVLARLAGAGAAMRVAPRRGGEEPLVEPFTALAERLLERGVRPRDEAVERDGQVEDELRHGLLRSLVATTTDPGGESHRR